MLRSIIIEDELQNLERLSNLLISYCPNVEVLGNAANVKTSFNLIEHTKPDLIFLDIQLSDGTAFDLLNYFDRISFKIIFITAFQEFALKAFRFSALDYLLKPVDPEELVEAVSKAQTQIESEVKLQVNNASSLMANKEFKKIVLKDFENIYLIKLSDISYCSADGNYTKFHLISDKPILISKPIKDYEAMLKDSGFFRIHRSFLINLDYFKRYEKSEGGKVILSNNTILPVALGRKNDLFENIDQFLR